MRYIYSVLILAATLMSVQVAQAGNPDRQGEAGAYELLMNPWARSAGFHGLSTAIVGGVEAIRINVAGLHTIGQTELIFARSAYLQGTGIYMNSIGFAQRVGSKEEGKKQNGVIGVSLMSLDFGDIPITTTDQPEGVGATYSPSFFNLGLSYSHTFEDKISVGITGRMVSEATSTVSAQGFALDAGIQYKTENIRFGISLRNVGTKMRFGGEGLSAITQAPNGDFNITLEQRANAFDLPSMLNIGGAYDFKSSDEEHRITVIGNFTSNSFGRDYVGGGVEYSFTEQFAVRGGYRHEIGGTISPEDESIYSGLSAGASINVPINKKKTTKLGFDYAYRATNVWSGTHNFGVRLNF